MMLGTLLAQVEIVAEETCCEEQLGRDLRPALHEELNRLPERYRVPVILCYLQGRTQRAAALRLRIVMTGACSRRGHGACTVALAERLHWLIVSSTL
jgi:DNA-directed RNA polymerase specialized sigma24 family protein